MVVRTSTPVERVHVVGTLILELDTQHNLGVRRNAAAMFTDAGGISFAHTLENLIFAFLGNAVGAGVFVAGAYWYLYLQPTQTQTGDHEQSRAHARAD